MSLFYNKKLSFTTHYFYIDFNDNNNLLKLCKPCSDVMSKIIMTACIWLFVSPVLKFYNCVGNKYKKTKHLKIYKSKCFCSAFLFTLHWRLATRRGVLWLWKRKQLHRIKKIYLHFQTLSRIKLQIRIDPFLP